MLLNETDLFSTASQQKFQLTPGNTHYIAEMNALNRRKLHLYTVVTECEYDTNVVKQIPPTVQLY